MESSPARGSETVCHMEPTAAQRAARDRIAAELAEYQPLFDNAKKLRALLSELQDLTLEIVGADSNQPPQSAEPETRGPESVG